MSERLKDVIVWTIMWTTEPNKAKENLKEMLDYASSAPDIAETFTDSRSGLAKIRNLKGKLGTMSKVLTTPETVIQNVHSVIKISRAIGDLRGNIRDNPQKAAKAFGKLFSGIGELAPFMPFPISSYVAIFADAEDFFENLRVQMQPEVHFREPGIREVINNL